MTGVQRQAALLCQLRHEFIGDAFKRENFLLTDTQQVVIVRATLNDQPRGAFHARGIVHKHWRVARAGANRALAELHGSLHHARTARYADQPDYFVKAHGLDRFEGRLLDNRDQILNAGLSFDGFVVFADGHRSAFRGGRMSVEDDAVASRDDVNYVTAQRRYGMSRGRDSRNDTKGSVFLERYAVVATASVRAQPFNAGHKLDDLQLLDLMIEPPNFRFFQFNAAPLDSVRISHRFYDLDDFLAGGDTLLLQLQKAGVRGGASLVGLLEDTVFAATDRKST